MQKVLSVISQPIPNQWLFSEVPPNSNVFLWKLHRYFLKNTPVWHELVLINNQSCRVKYYAEGKDFYVFNIFDSRRLLKISREEFYYKCDLNAYRTEQSCLMMNQLADDGLAPKCEYLGGCTMYVDNAGPQITPDKLNTSACLSSYFSQMQDWSLKHGIVILDLNENNWCFNDSDLLLVDIDIERTCLLQDIRSNLVVQKRINAKAYSDDNAALAAFLNEEKQLLWNYLNQR